MKTLLKIDHLSAWVLFAGMILYFISGYGMTKGIINPAFASRIHLGWLSAIIVVAFVFHTGFAIRLALIRWRIWRLPIKIIWASFFICFFLSFFYIDQFYKTTDTTTNQTASAEAPQTQNDNKTLPNHQNIKVFSANELSKYNGQNDNPAYVAVDGLVYDLSSVFYSGKHYAHFAGRELTNSFYSFHVKSSLSKYPIVGEYKT